MIDTINSFLFTFLFFLQSTYEYMANGILCKIEKNIYLYILYSLSTEYVSEGVDISVV